MSSFICFNMFQHLSRPVGLVDCCANCMVNLANHSDNAGTFIRWARGELAVPEYWILDEYWFSIGYFPRGFEIFWSQPGHSRPPFIVDRCCLQRVAGHNCALLCGQGPMRCILAWMWGSMPGRELQILAPRNFRRSWSFCTATEWLG